MTPLEWVGAIVAVLVSAGIALFGLGHLLDVLSEKWTHIVWRAAEKRIRERGSQMSNQSYWWDTPEKAAVWTACAEHMMDGNYPEASVVRDQTYIRHLKQHIANRPSSSISQGETK